jgi:hypothetical protein
VLLGVGPVFWVNLPAYLVTCVLVSTAMNFIAHTRERQSSRFELNAEATVYLDLPAVIDPGNSKDDLRFRFADPLNQRLIKIVRMLGDNPAQALQHFMHCLMEFRLARVAADDFGENGLELLVDAGHDPLY